MTRIRRVESEREQEKLVDEFMTKGYKVEEKGQYSAKVKEKDWGAAPVHAFVFIFALLAGAILASAAGTSGGSAWVIAILGSVTYAAYSRFTSEEIVIKVDADDSE